MRKRNSIWTVLSFLSSQVIAQPFFISCELEYEFDHRKASADFRIDEENKTVDGNPATFTDTSISYYMKSPGHDILVHFSRLTGRVSFVSQGEIVHKVNAQLVILKNSKLIYRRLSRAPQRSSYVEQLVPAIRVPP